MKFTKILATILCIAMLACVLVSCSGGNTEEVTSFEKPKELTISFKIKGLNGNILYEENEYVIRYYPEHGDPTILSVIDDYITIDCEEKFESKGNNIISIGNVSESENTYWVYHEGTATSEDYKYTAPGEVKVTDGFAFTIILIKSDS